VAGRQSGLRDGAPSCLTFRSVSPPIQAPQARLSMSLSSGTAFVKTSPPWPAPFSASRFLRMAFARRMFWSAKHFKWRRYGLEASGSISKCRRIRQLLAHDDQDSVKARLREQGKALTELGNWPLISSGPATAKTLQLASWPKQPCEKTDWAATTWHWIPAQPIAFHFRTIGAVLGATHSMMAFSALVPRPLSG